MEVQKPLWEAKSFPVSFHQRQSLAGMCHITISKTVIKRTKQSIY